MLEVIPVEGYSASCVGIVTDDARLLDNLACWVQEPDAPAHTLDRSGQLRILVDHRWTGGGFADSYITLTTPTLVTRLPTCEVQRMLEALADRTGRCCVCLSPDRSTCVGYVMPASQLVPLPGEEARAELRAAVGEALAAAGIPKSTYQGGQSRPGWQWLWTRGGGLVLRTVQYEDADPAATKQRAATMMGALDRAGIAATQLTSSGVISITDPRAQQRNWFCWRS